MKNKKVENNVTMESRVIACCGSVNFIEYTHRDLPILLKNMESNFKECCFIENYYIIAHYDTDTPHIHYALELTGQKRLKTLLNDFERMGYPRGSVNIDKLGFLNAYIKYMLHITEESKEDGKELYKLESLISSMPYEYLNDLLYLDDDEWNVDRLIQVCIECEGNKISIMRRLGLKTYHKWRSEIAEILNYEWSLRFARDNERKRREEENSKELPF